jgi:hypothetical protein
MDDERQERRQRAIEIIVNRSGLVERLGNQVVRAAGGLGSLAGSERARVLEAMASAVRRRIARELASVFEDDEALFEAEAWFESRAAALFLETRERLADTASPFAMLEDALGDPRMPERYREMQRARPVVVLDSRRGTKHVRPPPSTKGD